MNKIIKRTLIALFSVVFLVCTALFLAACGEEESGTPHYKVTLDYEQAQGTVVLSAPADEKGYVKDEVVTVTVAANLGYTQTAPTVKANNDDVTLTEGVGTFSVKGDTTVTVTFTADTNPDFLSGRQAFDFKNGVGFAFDSGAVTSIDSAGASGTYSIGTGTVSINGTNYTVKGTTLTIDNDVYYVSDVVNVVTVTENEQSKPFAFSFGNAEWVADPVTPYVDLDIDTAIYDGHVAEEVYYDGTISVRYAVAGAPERVYVAEIDFADLSATSEQDAVAVYTASTADPQYRAEIQLVGNRSMTLYKKNGANYEVVFEGVSRSNSSGSGKDYFWQGTQTVGDLVTTYKATLTGATYLDNQDDGKGGTTEVGDYSAAVLTVQNLGSVHTKTLTTISEDYKVTITYNANNAITVTRLQKKEVISSQTVYTDVYGGNASGAECTGTGKSFTITKLDNEKLELVVYTITFTGDTPADWAVAVTPETTKIAKIETVKDADHAYYHDIILAVDSDGKPTDQGIIGSFTLEYVEDVYKLRTITVKSCTVSDNGEANYTITVTDTDDNEIEFTLDVIVDTEHDNAISYEMYEELTVQEVVTVINPNNGQPRQEESGNAVTFAVAGGQASKILSVTLNNYSVLTNITTQAVSSNINVWTVNGVSADGRIEYDLTVTFIPAASGNANVSIEIDKTVYTYEETNEDDGKTYVVRLEQKQVQIENTTVNQIVDVVSVQIKNDDDAPNTDVVIENIDGVRELHFVGEDKLIVWFNATYYTSVGDNTTEDISLAITVGRFGITIRNTGIQETFEATNTGKSIDLTVMSFDKTWIVSVDKVEGEEINQDNEDQYNITIDPDNGKWFAITLDGTEYICHVEDFSGGAGYENYYIVDEERNFESAIFNSAGYVAEIEFDYLTNELKAVNSLSYSGYMYMEMQVADIADMDSDPQLSAFGPIDYEIDSQTGAVTCINNTAIVKTNKGTFLITVFYDSATAIVNYAGLTFTLVSVADSGEYTMYYESFKANDDYGVSGQGFVAGITFDNDGKIKSIDNLIMAQRESGEATGAAFNLAETQINVNADGHGCDFINSGYFFNLSIEGGQLKVTFTPVVSLNAENAILYNFKNGDLYSFTDATHFTITPKDEPENIKNGTYEFDGAKEAKFTLNGVQTVLAYADGVFKNNDIVLLLIKSDSHYPAIFNVDGYWIKITFTGESSDNIDVYSMQYSTESEQPEENAWQSISPTYENGKVSFDIDSTSFELDLATLTLKTTKVETSNFFGTNKLVITYDSSKNAYEVKFYVDDNLAGTFYITIEDVNDPNYDTSLNFSCIYNDEYYPVTISGLGKASDFADMAKFFADLDSLSYISPETVTVKTVDNGTYQVEYYEYGTDAQNMNVCGVKSIKTKTTGDAFDNEIDLSEAQIVVSDKDYRLAEDKLVWVVTVTTADKVYTLTFTADYSEPTVELESVTVANV